MNKHIRSLGVVIYPDGSQAEVTYERWLSNFEVKGFIWTTVFRPLFKLRKLTMAPFNLPLNLEA